MNGTFEKLRAAFDPSAVSWRPGRIVTNDRGTAGMALAYIDARDVMNRLDEVVGPGGWSDSYQETAKGVMLCTLSLRIGGEWVSKTDGAGETDVEAEKGKVSDAFKRAAVKWGIGRYLYDVPTFWVECDPKSKQITKKGYEDLQGKLRDFAKRHSQAPLAAPLPVAPPPAAPAEHVDPQTGEIKGDVVREVIAAHKPEPAAPAPEASTNEKPKPPSCIIPGKLTPEEIAARKEKEKADAIAAFKRESNNITLSWCDMLQETAEAAKNGDTPTRKLVASFEAWEQVRKAMWNKITPDDQARVRKAYASAKQAIDRRRASAAA